MASGSVASPHLCDVFSGEGIGRFLELENGDEEDHDEFDDGGQEPIQFRWYLPDRLHIYYTS